MTAHMEVNMGGYFSTRWGSTPTRQDTDPLLKLDIRTVHKMGALQPGAVATHEWTSRGEPAGTITTIMSTTRPALTLSYSIRKPGENWQPIKETVFLDTTPCNYGGERFWFHCPRCHQRRAVLFSVDGYFRCRACHDLAYSSTREDAHERSIRRTRTLQRELRAPSNCDVFTIPPKPDGMSWSKYDQLVFQLKEEIKRQSDLFVEEFTRRFGHLR